MRAYWSFALRPAGAIQRPAGSSRLSSRQSHLGAIDRRRGVFSIDALVRVDHATVSLATSAAVEGPVGGMFLRQPEKAPLQ